MYPKRHLRKCEICSKEFWFRDCYAQRPGKPGRFCSKKCRAQSCYGLSNPNVSELAIKHGPQNVRYYAAKARYDRIRIDALQKLSGGDAKCQNCGCNYLPLLEVNHKNGGGSSRRECGIKLWRMVIKLENPEIYFNVLCKVCNQADYVSRAFGVHSYEIKWR